MNNLVCENILAEIRCLAREKYHGKSALNSILAYSGTECSRSPH